MRRIERDEIIIRKAIVHILDCDSGFMKTSNTLLDPGPDLNEFLRGHIYRLVDSDDTKKCHFNEDSSPRTLRTERPLNLNLLCGLRMTY